MTQVARSSSSSLHDDERYQAASPREEGGAACSSFASVDRALYARLDAIEAHPVMVRALAERAAIARLTDSEPPWMAEGRELIERAG